MRNQSIDVHLPAQDVNDLMQCIQEFVESRGWGDAETLAALHIVMMHVKKEMGVVDTNVVSSG